MPRPVFFAALGIPLAFALDWLMCGMLGFAAGLLFHETGHAAAAIFFGHPAIPSAAGVCHIYDRSLVFAILVWAIMAVAAWHFRERAAIPLLLGAGLLASVVIGFTGFRQTIILLAGHGGEVAFGCLFLWRALQGGLFREFERPLYAMLGWYLLGRNTSMFYKLRNSPEFRAEYSSESFVDGPNDFEAVADIHDVTVETVAGFMLAASLASAAIMLASWFFFSLRKRGIRLDA